MKKIFNIALLSVFISGLSVNYLNAKAKLELPAPTTDVWGNPLDTTDDKGTYKRRSNSNMNGRDMKNFADPSKLNFSTLKETLEYYQKNDDDIKTVLSYLKDVIGEVHEEVGGSQFKDIAKTFGSYLQEVVDYSSLSTNGKIEIAAYSNEKFKFGDDANENTAINALIAFKWTLSIYKSMRDYNGLELNKYDVRKIYKSIMALIEHAPRNMLTFSPKIERTNITSALLKKVWDGKGKIKQLPVILKIKLNKGKSDGVWGYLRLSGIGNKLTKEGRKKRSISVDLFMPNNTDIKGQLGKRFYIDKLEFSKDKSESSKAKVANAKVANTAWENIADLEDLLKETVERWVPRSHDIIKDSASDESKLEVKNITLKDILKICINGDVECNETVNGRDTMIYLPEYIDFTGFGNQYKGAYLLRQQEGRAVSELFKKVNRDGTYTVVIGVIKNGKALANIKTFGFKGEKEFNTVVHGAIGGINAARSEGSFKAPARHYVVKDVHNVIYVLTVESSEYNTFIQKVKRYDPI